MTADHAPDAAVDAELDAILRAQLDHTLADTPFRTLGGRAVARYDGKVRDCLIDAERGERVIIVTDRLSAFDAVVGTIPFKGQVLNQLAQFWFERTRAIAPNHMLRVPDPNVMVARECEPLPVELVMRAYLTGVTSTSIWKAYEAGARTFCGHAIPDGMRKNEPLPRPISRLMLRASMANKIRCPMSNPTMAPVMPCRRARYQAAATPLP